MQLKRKRSIIANMANPERPIFKIKILSPDPTEYEMPAPECLKGLGYCSLDCPSFVVADVAGLITGGETKSLMGMIGEEGATEFKCELEQKNKFQPLPLPLKPIN